MAKTTAEKLRITPGTEVRVLASTSEQRSLLGSLPEETTLQEGITSALTGVAVLFAEDRAALDSLLDQSLPHLRDARATWIAYPKGGRSDINRDSIWARAAELGWTANANVALDEAWSAVRIKPVT